MSDKAIHKIIDILLVDDSPADVLLTREALSEAKLLNTIHVAEDGVEAMEFLHKTGKYIAAPRPELILLDLNLPRKNGREVLAEIKSDENLKSIPVVVLTTSSAEEDILKSYNLHANCYVVKPVEFNNFVKAIQSIRHFWFSVVSLPQE
jgi:two-component system, chemotaxis family, response regulator Rcp1